MIRRYCVDFLECSSSYIYTRGPEATIEKVLEINISEIRAMNHHCILRVREIFQQFLFCIVIY